MARRKLYPRGEPAQVQLLGSQQSRRGVFFFDDLVQRGKVQEGDTTKTVKEPVYYSARLLVVDYLSMTIAVIPLYRKQ